MFPRVINFNGSPISPFQMEWLKPCLVFNKVVMALELVQTLDKAQI